MIEQEAERRYVSVTETAVMIRKAIKAAFPGVTFSVRSSKYAGGASIDVGWVDGPGQRAVEKVVKPFAGASFDGMTDMKSYHSTLVAVPYQEMPEVMHFGADYVFAHRVLSPEYEAVLTAAAQKCLDQSGGIEPGTVFEPSRWYTGACEFGTFDVTGYGMIHMLSRVIAPNGEVIGEDWRRG